MKDRQNRRKKKERKTFKLEKLPVTFADEWGKNMHNMCFGSQGVGIPDRGVCD